MTGSGIALLSIGVVILITLLIVALVIGRVGSGAGAPAEDWALEPEQEAPVTAMAEGAVISIPGMESMTFPAGSRTVSTRLYNPEDNPCYFEIAIVLEDGTELYRSDMVSPGQELYEIELSQALEAGEYSAVLQYSTYSLDEAHTPMNGADVPFTLYVTG